MLGRCLSVRSFKRGSGICRENFRHGRVSGNGRPFRFATMLQNHQTTYEYTTARQLICFNFIFRELCKRTSNVSLYIFLLGNEKLSPQ